MTTHERIFDTTESSEILDFAAYLAASSSTVHIPIDKTVVQNLIVPASCSIRFLNNAKFSHDTYTIHFVGKLIDDPLWQLFDGTGAVTFAEGSVPWIRPEWWGLAYDIDCTAAVQSAIDAAPSGSIVLLSGNSYVIDGPLTNTNNVIVIDTSNTIYSILTASTAELDINGSIFTNKNRIGSLTANRVIVTDANKYLVSTSTTDTEIGYVHEVTAPLQTQLNGKEPSISAGTTSQWWRGDKSWQTIDHAGLDNLNSTTYYHLTEAEYTDLTDGGSTILHIHDHAGLSNLNSASYYHLTAAEYAALNTGSGMDNYVVKRDGTYGLQDSIIFDNDTNVGIGTSSPLEKLDISGGIRVQQYEKFSSSYSVPAATWVTINWRYGVSTLEERRVYRVTLSTSGTGTGGSSVYLVRCTEDDPLTFEAKRVSAIRLGTNYPSLQVNGTHLEIAQGHASSTYSVTVTVDTYFHNNLGQTQYSLIGIEDSISTYNGMVGIGIETPTDLLHVFEGSSGTTAEVSNGLTVESDGAATINLLYPDASLGQIIFGSPSEKLGAQIVSRYNSGNPYLAFYTNGSTERVRIASNGMVGVGTTTPTALLDVTGTPISNYEEQINALFKDTTAYGTGVGGGIGFSGKYNSSGAYSIFGAIKAVKKNATNDNKAGELHFQTNTGTVLHTSIKIDSAGSLNFVYLTASRITYIDSLNNLQSSSISVDGSGNITFNSGLYVASGNDLYLLGAATGAASSDVNIDGSYKLFKVTSSKRYKEKIKDFSKDSSLLQKIELKDYQWKDNKTVSEHCRGKDDFGFIAEQVAEIMPELANYDESGKVTSWKTQKVVELLVAEVQRLNKRIDTIEGINNV
jgi:hypothetical protein